MTTPNVRREIITRVKTLVSTRHFNAANIDYEAWRKEVDLRSPALTVADDAEFESGISDLISMLKSSHTKFLRADAHPTKPQHAIGATLRPIVYEGASRWMFLDVYDGAPAAVSGIKPGNILFSVNRDPAIPPAEPSFRFGEDHTLSIGGPGDRREVVVSVPQRKGSKRRPPLVEPQSVAYRIVKPGVGLLKIPFFSGAFGIRFSRLLDSAVQSLKNQGCDRLIVDLRGCLGGSLGFARLASYLCPGRIPIGYDITRKRLLQGYNVSTLPRVPMPSTRTGLVLCLLRFSVQDKSLMLMTQGLGSQPFHGRTAILINEFTNSAGEMAAKFAKDTRLATLIGRKTIGNVLGGAILNVGHGYKLYLPIFGWYSPDGTYAEGSGVEPDIDVEVDPNDLARGQDAQMNKAIEILGRGSACATS